MLSLSQPILALMVVLYSLVFSRRVSGAVFDVAPSPTRSSYSVSTSRSIDSSFPGSGFPLGHRTHVPPDYVRVNEKFAQFALSSEAAAVYIVKFLPFRTYYYNKTQPDAHMDFGGGAPFFVQPSVCSAEIDSSELTTSPDAILIGYEYSDIRKLMRGKIQPQQPLNTGNDTVIIHWDCDASEACNLAQYTCGRKQSIRRGYTDTGLIVLFSLFVIFRFYWVGTILLTTGALSGMALLIKWWRTHRLSDPAPVPVPERYPEVPTVRPADTMHEKATSRGHSAARNLTREPTKFGKPTFQNRDERNFVEYWNSMFGK